MDKKQKQLAVIAILVVAVLYFNPSLLALVNVGCVQESANVASACGGLSTGNYSGTATLAYDTNWETYSGDGQDFTVTYMKPVTALSTSIWAVRDGTSAYNPALNTHGFSLDIPSDCWSKYSNKLIFKAIDGGDSVTWACDNGGWKTLRFEAFGGAMREEAMVWDIPPGTACTNTCSGGQSQYAYPDCSCYTPTGTCTNTCPAGQAQMPYSNCTCYTPIAGTNNVTGPATVDAGSTQTYNAILTEPYAGSYDQSTGILTSRYCGMALVNGAQAVISETGFTACTTGYTKAWTLTMPPNAFTNYAVIAVMTENKQHYSSGTWVVDYTNKVIQQAALGVTSKVVAAPIGTTAPAGFGGIISQIGSFIGGIFSTLASWLHTMFGLGVVLFLS